VSVLLVLGAVGLLVIKFPNTGTSNETPFSNEPAAFQREPKSVALTKDAKQAALTTAANFIKTAVVRRHVDASWNLATPTLRAGYTRKDWARGEIPVVPFPRDELRSVQWSLDYSYKNTVGLLILLEPKPHAKLRPAQFLIELRAFGSAKRRYWLVDSWTPTPTGPTIAAPAGGGSSFPVSEKSPLGAAWLFIPIGIVGLALLIPIGVGVREWRRGRSASRAYAERSPLPELTSVRSRTRW
jgi:hypothetical protein